MTGLNDAFSRLAGGEFSRFICHFPLTYANNFNYSHLSIMCALCTSNRYMRMNNTVDVANEHVFKLRKMVSRNMHGLF